MKSDIDILNNFRVIQTMLMRFSEEDTYKYIAENDLYWHSALNHINAPQNEIDEFWKHFEGKERNRKNATLGNVTVNHERAYFTVKLAQDDDAMTIPMLGSIGLRIVKIIRDPEGSKILKQMARCLDDPPVPKQGGLSGKYGVMWKAFCRCHLNGLRLPSKKEVRTEARVCQDLAELKKAANEELEYLGLGGLREE